MKTCSKCGVEKQDEEFFRGHRQCKACFAKVRARWKRTNAEKTRASQAKYNAEHRAEQLEHAQRWQREHPEAHAAHVLVKAAVRRGELVQGPCAHAADKPCGGAVVAHHWDYDKPLDVVWLCRRHHRMEHARLRDEH